MGKAKLGITRDFFDTDGNLIIPGPGLTLLDDLPDLDWHMIPEFLPELTPAQIEGCDMVISSATHWTAQSVADNDRLVAVLYTGVGYRDLDRAGPS